MYTGGGGLTMGQAQWLIHFMRNLPGGAPAQPTEDEYQQAMAAQRDQAAALPPPPMTSDDWAEGPDGGIYDYSGDYSY